MKAKNRIKGGIIPIQRRFMMDYEYIYGSDKIKSYIKKVGKRRGKYQVFDDPTFDILE